MEEEEEKRPCKRRRRGHAGGGGAIKIIMTGCVTHRCRMHGSGYSMEFSTQSEIEKTNSEFYIVFIELSMHFLKN